LEHTARALAEAGVRADRAQWEQHLILGDGWKVSLVRLARITSRRSFICCSRSPTPEDLGLCDVTLVLDRPPTDGTAPRLSRQAAQGKRPGMTSDLLVFLRGKDSDLAPCHGTIVTLVLEGDTGPIKPGTNRATHLSISLSDTAGEDNEVHPTEHSDHGG
jgi:hypothetical protein